ncbi:MAG: molybdopterin-guanine dinucleotide biosynthesis protein B, partial [Oscillospiraceae bacterium]|nr:molybdopterin-guanine dinucleotide biosynthesis protein B [Oscillospiraceae bacterium]
MNGIPVIGFSAYSGTGKTTLIEKLIVSLKTRGLRVAAVKHDVHGFEIDRPGKDSRRFSDAGADISIISSPDQTALIDRRSLDFNAAASLARDVDVILVEGFKHGDFTHIGMSRSGSELPGPPDSFAAIVTDEDIDCGCPKFSFDDIDALTEFIMTNMNDF